VIEPLKEWSQTSGLEGSALDMLERARAAWEDAGRPGPWQDQLVLGGLNGDGGSRVEPGLVVAADRVPLSDGAPAVSVEPNPKGAS
jgi:hypothetical protein